MMSYTRLYMHHSYLLQSQSNHLNNYQNMTNCTHQNTLLYKKNYNYYHNYLNKFGNRLYCTTYYKSHSNSQNKLYHKSVYNS